MALVRAANPEIIHTENSMEWHSSMESHQLTRFPPMDPWLSGIQHLLLLLWLSFICHADPDNGVSSSVGYNLVAAFWFGMTAVGAYGILWDLLGLRQQTAANQQEPTDI
jgi:uncharacterized membrane protein